MINYSTITKKKHLPALEKKMGRIGKNGAPEQKTQALRGNPKE